MGPVNDNFEIRLPLFEGPFDLLLFFIERDELDIQDIPIAKITDDFLNYLHRLEAMNMEVASEFILVAATLMRIKAKMLLPRPQIDEATGQEIDPREELAQRLLEYKKYKSVTEDFRKKEENELMKERRGNLLAELKQMAARVNVEAELQDLDLFRLFTAFDKVLKRRAEERDKPTHRVVQYPYTIQGQRAHIRQLLAEQGRLSIVALIESDPIRIVFIFNFLTILEMLSLGELKIQLGDGYNNFWIMFREPATAPQESLDN